MLRKFVHGLYLIGLLAVGALAFTPSHAAATIDIRDPAGIYAPGVITLDSPGTVRWNEQAVDKFYSPYVLSGDCSMDLVTIFTGASHTVGFTCRTAGSVHITTTGQLTSTCAYDGAILEGLHLSLTLDGVGFYNKQLWPNPITCYVTPSTPASVTWSAPYLVFDNTTQARPSASTAFYVRDPNWLYSNHTFTSDGNVSCGPYLVNVGTRFKRNLQQVGFTCSGIVPANGIVTVLVN